MSFSLQAGSLDEGWLLSFPLLHFPTAIHSLLQRPILTESIVQPFQDISHPNTNSGNRSFPGTLFFPPPATLPTSSNPRGNAAETYKQRGFLMSATCLKLIFRWELERAKYPHSLEHSSSLTMKSFAAISRTRVNDPKSNKLLDSDPSLPLVLKIIWSE